MSDPSAPPPGIGVAPRDDVALMAGYHSPQLSVEVRLNTNESPEEPPAEFADALAEAVRDLPFHRYPDRAAADLRRAIAEHHSVEPAQVFAANGSNEAILCLLLAYGGPGRSAIVFEPTYALHSHIARITGTAVVAGVRDATFHVDPGHAAATLARAEQELGAGGAALTFLCSPNNPTGGVEPRAGVEAIADASPGLLVVDEAYGQFAPWTAVDLLAERRRVVVIRTFSKTWAMAGLRLGYLVADPEVVAACERVALPYHLDAAKQAAGRLALGFEPEMRARVARLVEQRGRVLAAIADLGCEVWPSDANFILFRVPIGTGARTWQRLVDRSVLVRDLSSWPGLEDCLRVTIGTPSENDRFLVALGEALEG